MTGPDPIVAMQAAVIAVGNGEAGEIELEWRDVDERSGCEQVLSITVRRSVKHFRLGGGTTDDEQP